MGTYIYQAILTPENEGGYSVEVPDLPGCYSCGDDVADAAVMAADAAKTYVSLLLGNGEEVPKSTTREVPDGEEGIWVFFEADPSWIVTGPVVSAAEAARRLGVSPGRVTQMIDGGILDGYRDGRRTYVSTESIERRLAQDVRSGRPKRSAMA